MDRRNRYLMILPVLAMLVATSAVGGCKSDDKKAELMPPPPGYYVRTWERRQIAAADQDMFVIYRFEWEADATEPSFSPYGRHHFGKIMDKVAFWPHPIVIEKEPGEPHVDAARRNEVIARLTEAGIRRPETRVEVRELKWQSPYQIQIED